jgi:hypothetical protein
MRTYYTIGGPPPMQSAAQGAGPTGSIAPFGLHRPPLTAGGIGRPSGTLRAMRRTLLLFVALSLLAGCPTVTLSKIVLKDGSVTATSLTLQAEVIVEETEEVDAEAGSANEGRAVVALYLPQGWNVSAARMKSPQESATRKLIPVPQSAVQFGETFPDVPGQWWAFASNTQTVLTGKFVHNVELDVTFPKKSKGAEVGVIIAVLADDMDEVPAPQVFDIGLKGKKGTMKARAFEGAVPAADPAAGNTDKASAG